MVKQSGFSLVELMVTLAVTMFLAVASAPFAQSWSDQAAVRQTQSLVQQSMGQLRSSALRNASGVNGGPSAVLVSSQGTLCVQSGVPAALNCSNAVWTSKPVANLKLNDASDQCLAMNSAGSLLSTTIAGTVCATQGNFQISRGSEVIDGSLN